MVKKVQIGNATFIANAEQIQKHAEDSADAQTRKEARQISDTNKLIRKKLAALDAKRSRSLADVALGNGEVATGDPAMTPIERLEAIEVERAALAAQLQ